MAKIMFRRTLTDSDVSKIPIEDGNFIVSGSGTTYIDYGDDRIPVGGTADNEVSDISGNSIQNKVIKKYVDDKFEEVNKKLSPLNEFSLDEQIVGTWINGKPLYRKVYQLSNSNSFSLNNNMDELIFSSCTIQLSLNNEWRPVPWISVSNSSYQFADYGGGYYINPDGGWTVYFQIGNQLSNMKRGIMVFIYTKTTD